jgi:hypothetical protein
MYSKTNINNIFDFSSYPVKIITETYPILKHIYNRPNRIEPAFYTNQLLIPKDVKDCGLYIGYYLNNKKINFNLNRSYPKIKLLVRDDGGSPSKNIRYILKYIKFTNEVKQKFREISFKNMEYNAIHIRTTDTDIDSVKYKKNYNDIIKFIENSVLKVFLASDNKNILTDLKDKYKDKILLSNTTYYNNNNKDILNLQYGNLHQYGTMYSDVLLEAIYDLLLLSCANNILITNENSGYSRMAKFLCENKNILNNLIK